MVLTVEDAKAAADMVGVDMTVAADKGGVAITISYVVNAPQAHTPPGPTYALTKKPLTAQNRSF